MAHSEHSSTPGMSFVSAFTHHHRPIFGISRIAELFVETILQLRTLGRFKLHGFLVMPHQVHLILTPQGLPLERAVSIIQETFARNLGSVHAVWEPGFNGYPIRNLRDLDTLRNHLHQLPVQAQLCQTAESYPYSSAYRTQQITPVQTTTLPTELAS